jgi:hypothetical protein
MTRAKKAVTPSSPSNYQPYKPSDKAEWFGFINIKMTELQETSFHELDDEFLFWLRDQLDIALTQGFKLSVVMDADHDCYIATLTGKINPETDSRACLSARNASMQSACDLLSYKHFVCLAGDWGKYQPSTGKIKFG